MFLHVIQARHLGGYQVEVTFNDGRTGIADLSGELEGTVFAPLKDQALFSGLRVDPELATIVWPNGADLAPEFLYFQAFKRNPELAGRFRDWGYLK